MTGTSPPPDVARRFLGDVRSLLAPRERWTRGALARDVVGLSIDPAAAGAVRWCLAGASARVARSGGYRDWTLPALQRPLVEQIAGRKEPPAAAAAAAELASLCDALGLTDAAKMSALLVAFNDNGSLSDVLDLFDDGVAPLKMSALLVAFNDNGSHRDVLDLIDAAVAALPAGG
ncbi:MAG: hypothetical protein F4Z29_00835 [Gemmatimonadetes bacterium]|nr:hypothetical protein [Gemmatimonadota bacterium]